MRNGEQVRLKRAYKTSGPNAIYVRSGSTGRVVIVDFDGNVAVKFDEPFYIGGWETATGLTFTPEGANVYLESMEDSEVAQAA